MKRLWAASALLAVLLGAALVNAWYSRSFTEKMAQELEQACQMARDDDWEGARRLTWAVYQDWQGKHFYLHTVMRHGDTDQILRSFQGVLQYCSWRRWTSTPQPTPIWPPSCGCCPRWSRPPW